MDAELVHDLLTVLFDRLDADLEVGADLFAGFSLRDKVEDFTLAKCQFPFPRSIRRRRREKHLCDRRAKECVPLGDFPNSTQKLARYTLFHHVPGNPGLRSEE